MKLRQVTHEEAQQAYTAELEGSPFRYGDICDGRILAISFPERPSPGGTQSKGYLPLTYQIGTSDGPLLVATDEGPEVDEMRSFLYATLPGIELDEKLELWFDGETGAAGSCGC
jgi:hypothetical protein